MPKDDKIQLGLPVLLTGELMAMRGEMGIFAMTLREMEGIDPDEKEKLLEIANRNFDKFKSLEKIFEELIHEENSTNKS